MDGMAMNIDCSQSIGAKYIRQGQHAKGLVRKVIEAGDNEYIPLCPGGINGRIGEL